MGIQVCPNEILYSLKGELNNEIINHKSCNRNNLMQLLRFEPGSYYENHSSFVRGWIIKRLTLSSFRLQNMALGLNLSSFCLQFGAWLCWICWLVLSILSLIKVYHYHKKEAFLSSMNRERQRLLQRVGHTEPMVLWGSLRTWPLDRSGGLKVPPSLLKGRTWLHTKWPHP